MKICSRSSRFDTAWPFMSLAVTVTVDVEMPSCWRRSGVAEIASAIDISDGPVSGGSLTSWTVHPAATSAAARKLHTLLPFILGSREIREVDRDAATHADLVAHGVSAIKGDVGDNRHHDWLGS